MIMMMKLSDDRRVDNIKVVTVTLLLFFHTHEFESPIIITLNSILYYTLLSSITVSSLVT
jgi:hypothetical protein